MRLGEEIDQRVDHGLADALDVVEVAVGLAVLAARDRAITAARNASKRAERLGEVARRRLADMADAERVDEAVERDAAARLDGLEQVLDRLGAVALLLGEPLVRGQARVALAAA